MQNLVNFDNQHGPSVYMKQVNVTNTWLGRYRIRLVFLGKILFVPKTPPCLFYPAYKIPFWECSKHGFISQEMLKGTGRVISGWLWKRNAYFLSSSSAPYHLLFLFPSCSSSISLNLLLFGGRGIVTLFKIKLFILLNHLGIYLILV